MNETPIPVVVFAFGFAAVGLFDAHGPGLGAKSLLQPSKSTTFGFCNVKSYTTPEGTNTLITAQIYDPQGSPPYPNCTIAINGPNGSDFNTQSMSAGNYDPLTNTFWVLVSGTTPPTGEYVFTVTDSTNSNNPLSATSYYYLANFNPLPVVDSSTLNAYPGASSSTPTLTWSDSVAGNGYYGNYFFRARIYDPNGNIVWTSEPTGSTSVTVPAGVLPAGVLSLGTPYSWSVIALDNAWGQPADTGEVADNGYREHVSGFGPSGGSYHPRVHVYQGL